ncbi:MAG: ATP-binding protein [Prevotellaceae bacterium]|jgi:AAA15 family ATPase/GTPase|nr:ATP-binding protein [Prevotellaceae bacterium]
MLIEFTVGNFLSFNEKRRISFEARGGVSELKDNCFTYENRKLLRSVVVYGANSSGKSNLIKAFERMQNCVLSSIKLNNSDELDYSPFLLSSENENRPTFFEIIFVSQNQKFRYGFEYNQTVIINEWLFEVKKSAKEDVLFIRTDEGIAVSDKYTEGKAKEESTNNNRLFVSLVAQLGGKTANQILQFFENYSVISGVTHANYRIFSQNMFLNHSTGFKESLDLFQQLKLGFKDVKIVEKEPNQEEIVTIDNSVLRKILAENKLIFFNTVHNKYDEKGNVIDTVSWNKDRYESEGTKKLIDFSGPVFDTLNNGKVLIIDELDSKLHPLITIQIIKLFNSPKTNPNNAQLLFATHDTNLLSTEIFRRDQIWFTEKDKVEQTDLYSLDDFVFPDGKKVRKDTNLEKNYIAGRYGAIPYITNF